MYVLKENVEKVRGEEAANREAREKENDPGAVSNGLQGDVIQPLVIRANQGDCLKLTLHNEITDEPTNLVINGSSMVVAATGKPATPSNPEGTVASGRAAERSSGISSRILRRGRDFSGRMHRASSSTRA